MKKYAPKPRAREYVTLLLILIEVAIMGSINKNIFSNINISQVISNAAELSIVCIGMNIVIMLGGIDLSVGAIMGLSALAAGHVLQISGNSFLVIGTAVAVGALLGSINGFLIVRLKIPDMVATLATMNIYRAAIFGLLGGQWLTGLIPKYGRITTGRVFGVPVIIFLVILFYVCFYWITNYTSFGRKIAAVGTSSKSAALCGINPDFIRMCSYLLIGALAGVSGSLYIARMGAVEMQVGVRLHTDCIAAVVVGGMGMGGVGGKSTLLGTLAGVFFISFLRNGIVILGIPSLLEYFVTGLLIILSLCADVIVSKQKEHINKKKVAAIR